MDKPERPRQDSIVGYVADESRSFRERPLTRVDSLVLSQLAYFHWDTTGRLSADIECIETEAPRISDLYDESAFPVLFSMKENLLRDEALFVLACVSPRWSEVRVAAHARTLDDEAVEQFSATAFIVPCSDEANADHILYVAFSGTDMSITGWKEDFMLAFSDEIPSQAQAARFLEEVASKTSAPIVVGGHSKGGNLAIYATATCVPSTRTRICKVFNHDGPGFCEEAYERSGIEKISGIVDRTVPINSIVGMLLKNPAGHRVVRSSALGFAQHNPYTWIVRNGDFCYANRVSTSSSALAEVIRHWLSGMSRSEMRSFTDVAFDIMSADGSASFDEQDASSIFASISKLTTLDPDTSRLLADLAGRFLESSFVGSARVLGKR